MTLSIASYYNGSFAGTSFFEQSSSGYTPGKPTTTEGDVRHRPGSSDNDFDDQGAGAEPFTITVAVDLAEYQALIIQRGDTGSLVYSRGTITATLIQVQDSPGKADPFDIYTIALVFEPGATFDRPEIAVQIDNGVFPINDITDVTDLLLSADVDLGIDQDNASATVVLKSNPESITTPESRVYIYVDGTIIFNGRIVPGRSWAGEGVTIRCQGTMAKLRNNWGGEDRTYFSTTDGEIVQNLVEASGIDVSLTSIQDAGLTIGVSQDIIIHGGNIDPFNPEQVQSADNLLGVIRKIDECVYPQHCTFETGAGVVTRRPREVAGSSSVSFSQSNAWGWTRDEDVNAIRNHIMVRGMTIADVPLQSEASDTNIYLLSPWEYNHEEIDAYYLENDTDTQALADWALATWNGILYDVGWTTLVDTSDLLCATADVTSAICELSAELVLIKHIRHHIDRSGATTTFTGEYRHYGA